MHLIMIKKFLHKLGIHLYEEEKIDAKKILKAKVQNNNQKVLIFCSRYLGWWKILYDTLLRNNSTNPNSLSTENSGLKYSLNPNSEIGRYFLKYGSIIKSDKIVKMVISDIKINFPTLTNCLSDISYKE